MIQYSLTIFQKKYSLIIMKNSRTKKLVGKCNHILLNNFKKCGCVNKKGYPTNNIVNACRYSKKKKRL